MNERVRHLQSSSKTTAVAVGSFMTTFSMKELTFLRRLFGDMWRSLWKASTFVRLMPEKLVIE